MFRGSVIFDESGFLSSEMMKVYGAFAIVNKNFKSGKDRDGNSIDPIRLRTFPTNIPNQKFYISSASSTDTEFFRLYREFSKQQIMGNPDFCVIHIDCEVAFRPTIKGKVVAPLLSRETVQTEMRTNPEKARREYYCEFTSDAGTSAIIRRGTIARNEETRKPLLCNETGTGKFVICYDPARSRDNSVILVGELYEANCGNGTKETKMRLVNCINLIDIEKKRKTPMRTPEQTDYLKEVILDYNQGGDDTYSNIYRIYIDAGSGGGGVNIADYLMDDWTDSSGKTHRGLIDKEYSADYIRKFPNAVDKISLMSPTQFKSEMYEAAIELTTQDKVSFTAAYDNKGYLTIVEVDEEKAKKARASLVKKYKKENLTEEEMEEKIAEELMQIQDAKSKIVKLEWQEEVALKGIDALKEELVNMVRKPRSSGKDSFELCPEKQSRLHDDRAYTYVMACFALMNERRKNITNKKRKSNVNIATVLPIHQAKRNKMFG